MIKRALSFFVLMCFVFTAVFPSSVRAQGVLVPGTVTGEVFSPAVIKGIRIFPNEPLKFDFIVDAADSGLKGEALKAEGEKLAKYFLASLTTPEDEMWVNLSPLEPDRIVPEKFGATEMGRDLLSLDSVLKQAASSLTDPGTDLGKVFWNKVYAQAFEKFGTREVPADVINKVWIMPDEAAVYENGDKAFVAGAHLKVMLECDYLAMSGNGPSVEGDVPQEQRATADDVNNVMRAVIIPVLEKEVNEGKAFANLRQIYHAMILAAWFKRNLRESVLGKAYVDQNKIMGVDIPDKKEKLKIYDAYLEAFKKGAYNLVQEEYDPASMEMIPRKYFSGGVIGKIKTLTVFGPRTKAAVSFIKRTALTIATLVVMNVMFNACDDTRPRADADQKAAPRTERELAASGNYGDMVEDEFLWAGWTQDSISKYRAAMGESLEKGSPRDQIIALGHFIKSPEGGLGISYDTRFLADYDALQKDGDLDQVVRSKRTVCTGFARMLYFMLGHSVSILEVKDVGAGEYTHAMNIISLQGGKAMLVDLSTDSPDGFIMSAPFVLDELYEKIGDEYHLRDGQTIPWDHQNFNPRKDPNKAYQVFRFSSVLPYNVAVLFSRFENEKKQVFADFDNGNKLFDTRDYQGAIKVYREVVTKAEDLKSRMATNVVLRSVLQDPDVVVTNLTDLIQTANDNIAAAAHNMGGQQGSAGASADGEGTYISGVTQDDIDRFNKQSDEVQDLMAKGAKAIDEGNKKQDAAKYRLARTYYKEALEKIARMKKNSPVCKKQPDVLNKVEEAVKYNLDQLKDFAEASAVDMAGTSGPAFDPKNVGGIDLNAKGLKIQSMGKKIDFARFYGPGDLGRVPGLMPVITGMHGVNDLGALLGVTNL